MGELRQALATDPGFFEARLLAAELSLEASALRSIALRSIRGEGTRPGEGDRSACVSVR